MYEIKNLESVVIMLTKSHLDIVTFPVQLIISTIHVVSQNLVELNQQKL